MRHLIIAPHPDDAEIGMGPMIPKLAVRGDTVTITIAVCTGDGDLGMVHSAKTVQFAERVKEQQRACVELQCGLTLLNLATASKFDQVPLSTFVGVFDTLFHRYDAVYVPMPSYNNDHVVVWRAALSAMRPGRADKTNVYAYEQPFSNVIGPQLDQTFGKKYVGVSELDVHAAEQALLKHESQISGREDSIYGPKSLRRMAELRGSGVGLKFAVRLLTLREVVA